MSSKSKIHTNVSMALALSGRRHEASQHFTVPTVHWTCGFRRQSYSQQV